MKNRAAAVVACLVALPAAGAGLWPDNFLAPGIFDDRFWPASSEAATQVAAPNVEGLSLTDADTALEGVGLDTGTTTARCSAVAADEVIDQEPEAGVIVAIGSTVDLTYSSGVECPAGPTSSGKNVNSISIDMGIRL